MHDLILLSGTNHISQMIDIHIFILSSVARGGGGGGVLFQEKHIIVSMPVVRKFMTTYFCVL